MLVAVVILGFIDAVIVGAPIIVPSAVSVFNLIFIHQQIEFKIPFHLDFNTNYKKKKNVGIQLALFLKNELKFSVIFDLNEFLEYVLILTYKIKIFQYFF